MDPAQAAHSLATLCAAQADPVAALRQAQWIWPAAVYAPLRNVVADFVLDLDLEADDLSGVRLAVTADANYVAWINGRHVGRGPARGWQSQWPCDDYDVTRHLKPGRNRLAMRVYNPGRDTFRYVHANAAGLLAALVTESGRILAASGPGWQCRISPSRSRLTPQLSIQLEDQEHIDLRRDESAWRLPVTTLGDDSDLPEADHVDAAGTLGTELRWHEPRQIRVAGSPPWNNLEARSLPSVTSTLRDFSRVVSRGVGPVAVTQSPNPPADLRRATPSVVWSLASADAEPKQLTLSRVDAGEMSVVILDVGEPTIGTVVLDISGGTRGGRLDVVPFEACSDEGQPQLPDPIQEGRVAVGLRLTLSGGKDSFESFHAYGYRYLALVLHGPAGDVHVRPRMRETLYPVSEVGSLVCDDAELGDVRRVCARTQRIAMTDAYIDAWREQAQWWGDARVQFANHQAMECDDRLFARGIRQIASQRLPNGLTYGHVPTGAHTCVLPDFSLMWLLSLVDHWWQTGTTELAETHRDDACRVLNYFRTEGRGASGLLCNDPRYWLFLDWADIPKQGCPTLLNLWHVHTLDSLADVYEAAGDASAVRLRQEAADVRARVCRLLFDDAEGLWRDGFDTSGKPRQTYGTHAQALAVLAGFAVTPQMTRQIQRALSAAVDDDPAEPSPFWIGFLFDAATRLGMKAQVLACIRRRWRPMVRQGSTFEVWRPTLQESRSHAWSAHPLTHLNRIVAGVTATTAGWQDVTIEPLWNDRIISRCDAVIPTPRGLIKVRWSQEASEARLDLVLPIGVQATVRLADATTIAGVTGTRSFSTTKPVHTTSRLSPVTATVDAA